MGKYYDEKCLQCEAGCHFFGYGQFPNGETYEACRNYGYILHLDKGVSMDECEGFRTEEQWLKEQEIKKKKNESRNRK